MIKEKKRPLAKIGEMARLKWIVLSIVVMAVAVLLLGGCPAWATTNVTASVDRNAMNPEDTLTLTVMVESDEEVSASSPSLPKLNDFEVLNQWSSQSQQASMVSTPTGPKFKKVFQQRQNYMLQPKRQGNLLIGAVEVSVNGQIFNTRPISIKVAPGAGAQAPGRGRGRAQQPPDQQGGMAVPPPGMFDDDEDDLFSQLLRRVQPPSGGSRTLPINPQDAFFIQVETDKTDAYVGEQVTASFYLYTRGVIRDLDTLKYPALHGFWKEDIEIATHLNFQGEVVNGIPYKKSLLASFALFPLKEGSATVDPYQAKCSVITPDAMGSLNMKAYSYTKSSQPVKITVHPLPTDNRPTDFSGAVGDFQVTARIEDRNVTENQPFTLRVRFEGRGNAKLIDLPAMQLPEGMELYDNQNEAKFFRTGTSYKEFKVLLIPRHEGDFVVPAIGVSIFDPHTKQYVKKSTEAIPIHVGKGVAGGKDRSLAMPEDGGDAGKPSATAKAQEPMLVTSYHAGVSPRTAQAGAWSWIGVFALLSLMLLWRAKTELGWGERKKDLMRRLQTRLRRVDGHLQKGDWRAVGTEMTNTVYFVLGEISGEGGAHVELEKLLLKAPPSIRRELAGPLAKQMEVFHVLTFAPENVVGELKDPAKLKSAIQEMEKLMAKAVSLGLSAEQSSGSGSDPKAS